MSEEIKNIIKEIKSYENEELCLILLSQKQNKSLIKYITDLYQENKQLKEKLESSMKANIVLDNTNTDYASIIFELEEWLKERIEWNKSILKEDADEFDLLGINFHREMYIKVWEVCLDKIQELKEKYK